MFKFLYLKVRYHLDEDPKTLKVFPIPLHDSKGTTLHYDRLSVSPDGKILAVSHASLLQWLSVETGEVLDTADKSHDGIVNSLSSSHLQLNILSIQMKKVPLIFLVIKSYNGCPKLNALLMVLAFLCY